MAAPLPSDTPLVSQLREAPELGCLAVLDAALLAAELALVAAEPALDRDPRRRRAHDPNLSARYHVACTLLGLLDALRTALGSYRHAVAEESLRDDADMDDLGL